MPNLDHDPKNPTDLLDRPIRAGDYVAWGTTYDRSPAVAVCRIDKIRFIRKLPGAGRYGADKNVECEQYEAEDYQLRLEVLKTTGYVSHNDVWRPNGYIDPATGDLARYQDGSIKKVERLSDKPKLKTVHLVKNVVLLEPPRE